MKLVSFPLCAALTLVIVSFPVLTLHLIAEATPGKRITPELSQYFDIVYPLLGLTFLFLFYLLKVHAWPLIQRKTKKFQILYVALSLVGHSLLMLVCVNFLYWSDPDFLEGGFLLNAKSISPDGKQVAYISRGGLGSQCDLYLKEKWSLFVAYAGSLDLQRQCQAADGLKIVWENPSGPFKVLTPEGTEIPKSRTVSPSSVGQ